MNVYNIDTIVKGELLRHNLSIHYYIQRAYLALRFLRSINFDSAYYIKTETLTVTDNKITLPSDFVGLVRLGIKNGQYLDELAPDNKLLSNTDTAVEEGDGTYAYWYPNINKYGENLGGYFGYSHLSGSSYKILLEENKILINNKVSNVEDEVVLQYHSDGMTSGLPYVDTPDLAVYIHPYAVDAMIAYIDWKTAVEGNRFVSRELKQEYFNELRKYRARINPLTMLQVKRSLRKHYHASPKN